MISKPRSIVELACACGESPLWHPEQGLLYWLDVDESSMFTYSPASEEVRQVYGGIAIGGMTLHEDGRLLLFMAQGAIQFWSESEGLVPLIESLPGEEKNRFNNVIADPEGRVYCGIMPSDEKGGRLYRLDPDGEIYTILEDAGQPSGMAFSPDFEFFYLTDTRARKIDRFRYHRVSGALTERTTLIEGGEGNPDGLTVDSQGCLWSARWDGSCLARYSPEGKLLATVEFPARNVSSLIIVDQTAYVTTGGGKNRPEAGQRAGELFTVQVNVQGRAECRSRSTGEPTSTEY
jgi:sugar lactone lactonase YvrE